MEWMKIRWRQSEKEGENMDMKIELKQKINSESSAFPSGIAHKDWDVVLIKWIYFDYCSTYEIYNPIYSSAEHQCVYEML